MKKLLAVFTCLSLCLALGFGTVGCTKKDPPKTNITPSTAKPVVLPATNSPAKTAVPLTTAAPVSTPAVTTPVEKAPAKVTETPKVEPAPAPTKVDPKVAPKKTDAPSIDLPKIDPAPKTDNKGAFLNLLRLDLVPALQLRNPLVG